MPAYDIVGDIHGQAAKFEARLISLGYQAVGLGYKAPAGHQLVLLGDLIDRGPAQVRVLEIAKAMVDSGDALCIMGNHEFNAIAYGTEDADQPGESLRPNRGDSKNASATALSMQSFWLKWVRVRLHTRLGWNGSERCRRSWT